jgi:hypothetical protein
MTNDHDTWRFINTFAPWLSAIGTLLAVVISLYLARKTKEIKIKASIGHRIVIEQGISAPYPEFIMIYVVNEGGRVVTITNIGWEIGLIRKRYAVQTLTGHPTSHRIPTRLGDGEEATYLIPLENNKRWIADFVEGMLSQNPRLSLLTLRLMIYTSVGKPFSAKVEKSLKDIMLKEIIRQKNKKDVEP